MENQKNQNQNQNQNQKKNENQNRQHRSKNIDKKMFEMVKILASGGASIREITEYTGLSNTAIARVKRAENWIEFQNNRALFALEQQNAKKAAKAAAAKKAEQPKQPEEKAEPHVVEHRQSVVVQASYYTNQKLDKVVELLTGISAKLAFIVDELTSDPAKKEE